MWIVVGIIFVIGLVLISIKYSDFTYSSCEKEMHDLRNTKPSTEINQFLRENQPRSEEFQRYYIEPIIDDLRYIYGEDDLKWAVLQRKDFYSYSPGWFTDMATVVYAVYLSKRGESFSLVYDVPGNDDRLCAIAARALLVIDRNIRKYHDNKYWLCYDMCNERSGREVRVPRQLRWCYDVRFVTQKEPVKPLKDYKFPVDLSNYYPAKKQK